MYLREGRTNILLLAYFFLLVLAGASWMQIFPVQAAPAPRIYLVIADKAQAIPVQTMQECYQLAGVYYSSNPRKLVLCGEQVGK